MPIDPRIPMMGITPDIAGAMSQGILSGERMAQAPIRNQMLQQQLQVQENQLNMAPLQMQNAEMTLQSNQNAMKNEAGNFVYNAITSVQALPKSERFAATQQIAQQMQGMGYDKVLGLNADNLDDDLSDESLRSMEAAFKPFSDQSGDRTPFQKGSSGMVKDGEGNLFSTQVVFDPVSGSSGSQLVPVDPRGPQSPVGGISPVNTSGLTMPEVIRMSMTKATDTSQVAIRQGIAQDAFVSIGKANAAIGNIDSAIKAIDDGANTGPVDNWFPSFKTSTIELQNAGNRMGLDVIGAVTFGALSAGEMKLAMSTALPMDMQPKELKTWLGTRKRAQHKLRSEMMKAAQHFESNGSISDYLEGMKVRGDYTLRSDLPTITTPDQRASLKKGDHYLAPDENGNLQTWQAN
jgi:hypothetical protein